MILPMHVFGEHVTGDENLTNGKVISQVSRDKLDKLTAVAETCTHFCGGG